MTPYYQDSAVTIYHGDCREVLPVLGPVKTVITDPPYAVPTIIAQGRNAFRSVGDLSVAEAALGTFLRAVRMEPGGRMFVFCDQTSYPVLFRVIYGWQERLGMGLLVWDKGRIGMGREFRKSFELILHAWESKTAVFSDGVGRSDVLRASPVPLKRREHPSQKPVDLLTQLLVVCTGTVLDPFMGSGSTLVAARSTGHKAIGIEIEERYCEIAAKRMAQEVLPLESPVAR